MLDAAQTGEVLTAYGVTALVFMMAMYALEGRGSGYILAFGLGCRRRLALRRRGGRVDRHRGASLAAGRQRDPQRYEFVKTSCPKRGKPVCPA